MNFEQWAKGDSVFHGASPQIKIVGALCFCFGVASCQQLQSAVVGLTLACLGVLLVHIPLLSLFKRLFFVNIFTLVCWLTLPVTVMLTGTILALLLIIGLKALNRKAN